MDNPVVAAKAAGKSKLQRVGAYARAHWKELLALLLAAIPAAFLIFHAGARKQAQSLLTLPPLGAAAPGGADASTAITPAVTSSPSPTTSSSPSPTTPAKATSVSGSNPIKVAAPSVKSSSSVARSTGAIAKKSPAVPPAPKKTPPPKTVNQVLHLSGRQGGNVAPE